MFPPLPRLHVWVHVQVCVRVHAEARARHQESFFSNRFHLGLLRLGLSVSLELTYYVC